MLWWLVVVACAQARVAPLDMPTSVARFVVVTMPRSGTHQRSVALSGNSQTILRNGSARLFELYTKARPHQHDDVPGVRR